MEILLANNVNIDQEVPQLGTPLYVACTHQRVDCVKKLLELGNFQKSCHEKNLLHLLVSHGLPRQSSCQTGQNLAAFDVCMLKTELLQRMRASVDHGQWLDTPLHAAAKQSSVEVIHLLIDYGANLKCRNAQGKSALDLAAPKSRVEQALLLWEGPPALSQLCRLCIRKCLGRACHQSIHKLHLPEPLQRFLLYQ
ncbi:hypothetical protein QTO34_000909 [Cnephaeus nilssonii]|uniref:Ankyrin repeat and SOCS box protein 11 n=1 Tax=Cnephaeus nilssonii TaxID=3371016 RepID=A0AA40ICB1_CNENI|nr:hypothetical protein QTO34_000909 [Eptesicus nilssonii]